MKVIFHLACLLLFQCISACDQKVKLSQPSQSSPLNDSQRTQQRDMSVAVIVLKSTDSGHSWLNISKGLPIPIKDDYTVGRSVFFADDNQVYLTVEKGIYHSKQNAKESFWEKETLPNSNCSIAAGKAGLYAYNYTDGISQKLNGTDVWSPIFINFKEKGIRSVFETARGSIFIGTDRGLFKSIDNGKTWKTVLGSVGLGKMVESNGVLIATYAEGILKSTDEGENWIWVIKEGGVGIDVANIEGGFAAITFNTQSKTRRLRTSYDGGKTWQPIDAGLPASATISSIVEVGGNFFCGHPDGIYQSSDKGKTWKRILCPLDGKVFFLSVSGKVMYAILRNGGC